MSFSLGFFERESSQTRRKTLGIQKVLAGDVLTIVQIISLCDQTALQQEVRVQLQASKFKTQVQIFVPGKTPFSVCLKFNPLAAHYTSKQLQLLCI